MQETQYVDWQKALLSPSATLRQAISLLDETGLQIVIVVSLDQTLLGTVTDGDIRRGLLRGLTLDSSLESVINSTPFVAPPDMGHDLVLQLMRANKLLRLPIVDSERKVVGLHSWGEMVAGTQRNNRMVIMAGGLGKRLRPHTDDCPKPMLKVAGKPMLEHIIERAKLQGFGHFILAVHYLGHIIENYFLDGSNWGVHIEYLKEKDPLGTAGALGLLYPAPELPIVITNGDVLTDINYAEIIDFHDRHRATATMAVRQHEWQHPYGIVHIRGLDIIGFEEKPVHRTYVNAGVYVLSPSALTCFTKNEATDMPTVFERVRLANQKTIAYPMHEPWLDVGKPDDLEMAQNVPINKGFAAV